MYCNDGIALQVDGCAAGGAAAVFQGHQIFRTADNAKRRQNHRADPICGIAAADRHVVYARALRVLCLNFAGDIKELVEVFGGHGNAYRL